MTDWKELAATLFLFLGLFLLSTGCVAEKQAPGRPEATSQGAAAGRGQTLAILPFDNNSVTEAEKYEPLRQGLTAMLITDLKKSGTTLTLIERTRINAILKEIALGQTGSIDQATAIRAGRILGAGNIVLGAFMVLDSKVRLDTRIIDVETSEIVMGESITGDSDDFLGLESRLAEKIAASLNVIFTPAPAEGEGDITAAVYFSQGLEALDRGDRKKAEALFARSVAMDPAYRIQVNDVLTP